MKVKKVNRYYCDFCAKRGCSGGHMKRHEKGCTMNPNRVCGVCGVLGEAQAPILVLVAALPDPTAWSHEDDNDHQIFHEGFETEVNNAVKVLRTLCHNCPACIMAALRQRRIPVPIATEFNWSNEIKAIWDDINAERSADTARHAFYG